MVYQRIQRLSLAEHGESRTGDLLTRVTSDIDAVQDFITSALLGIVINVLTLAGMLGVMFYMNWRFTLIGLSVAPLHVPVRLRLHQADQEGVARWSRSAKAS